jgi:hypothetical protein
MNYTYIFDKLWEIYSNDNPSVKRIHELFKAEGETVLNDHIAYRTFNDPRVNIAVLAKPFLSVGYKAVGEYEFTAKKLRAVHFENPDIANSPKVFISELKTEAFSDHLQRIAKEILMKIPEDKLVSDELIFSGTVWNEISYKTYAQLREESEYAAWLYVWGFRANHFTVNVNAFDKLNSLEKVNKFLKDKGFSMNTSGGEIKGTKEMLLQQSSILADIVPVTFKEGIYEIPSCYYEFALRYPDVNGKLFSGFHADSADKIFESTNFYKKS